MTARLKRLLILSTIFSLVGCIFSRPHTLRFLGDSSDFKPSSYDENVIVYRHPTIGFHKYSKFIIDPVLIYREPHSKLEEVDLEDIKLLAEAFRQDASNALKDRYPLVDEVGPWTLRIQISVSDIKPGRWSTSEDGNLTFRFDTTLVGATLEIEGIDSLTGERIVALVNELKGEKYAAKEQVHRLTNVREAFRIWAKMLRKRFDEEKAKKEKT